MTAHAVRLQFPRLDVTMLSAVKWLGSYYDDGYISRSQQTMIERLRASHGADAFAVSAFGQVRIFSPEYVWCVDNSGQVTYKGKRP